MTLRYDINAALEAVPGADFHFVRPHRFRDTLDRIAERFLSHGRHDLHYVWLWERFRHEISSSHPSDALEELERRLQSEDRYWFLASDQYGKFWVAEATGSGILMTLREMYHFEYYIVDRHMTWLICANHHGMLVEASSKSPMIDFNTTQGRTGRG